MIGQRARDYGFHIKLRQEALKSAKTPHRMNVLDRIILCLCFLRLQEHLITLRDIELFIIIFFHQMPGFAFQLRAICTLLAVQAALGSLRTFNFTVHSAQRSPGLQIDSLPSSDANLSYR
jgi:hypothetical protein